MADYEKRERSEGEHEGTVTRQQDVWRVLILKVSLFVALRKILAALPLCSQS